MRSDHDRGPAAGQRADYVAQPGLARQRLESAVRKQPAQLGRERPQLDRARGALAVGKLALDDPPGAIGVEAVDPQAVGRGGLRRTSAGAGQRERSDEDGRDDWGANESKGEHRGDRAQEHDAARHGVPSTMKDGHRTDGKYEQGSRHYECVEGAHFSVRDQDREVRMPGGGCGNASKEHQADPRACMRAHDDDPRVAFLGVADDPLPDRVALLSHRLGVETAGAGQLGTFLRNPSSLLLDAVLEAVGGQPDRRREWHSCQGMPDGQDDRRPAFLSCLAAWRMAAFACAEPS